NGKRECSKNLTVSPAQRMHAKTCFSSGKAADGLTPGAYGSVRGDGKALRTQLAAFFNVPFLSRSEHRNGDWDDS
ncbi:MAG: hypothetical protein V3U07_09540, partial [Nitrospirales bacterium]